MNEPLEIWRRIEVDNEEWPYEVSNKGRIKSLERLVRAKGNSKRLVKERILKLVADSSGYQFISMHYKGKGKQGWVHTLVCTAFHGSRPSSRHQVRHFPDLSLTNNNADNLRWGTAEEQYVDRIIHGTDNSGERNNNSKLTKNDIPIIRRYIEEGLSHAEIANKFGVTKGAIGHIRHNRAWVHVS